LNLEFRKSFRRDLKRIQDPALLKRIRAAIVGAEQAKNLGEIENLRKLRGTEGYYRVRIGQYRLGLIVEGNTIIFVRCLHRKDVYRYFP
jgi:mRNA interferase RelE/StbE